MSKLDDRIAPELTWVPFLTLLRREIRRFTRVLAQTVFIPMVNSILYLLIFGLSLGRNIHISTEYSYLAFLIPGLVMMGVLNNAFQNTSSSIATSKFHGDLEDLRKGPISAQQILWAMSIGGLIRGLVIGVVTYVVGAAFYYVTQSKFLPIHHPFILFFFLCLGGIAFAQLGIAIAFWSKTIDQLSLIGGFILLPLMYLGGVFFSLEHLHPFWQILSHFNPLLYFINGVRYGILGVSDIPWTTAALAGLLTQIPLHFISLKTIKHGSYSRW